MLISPYKATMTIHQPAIKFGIEDDDLDEFTRDYRRGRGSSNSSSRSSGSGRSSNNSSSSSNSRPDTRVGRTPHDRNSPPPEYEDYSNMTPDQASSLSNKKQQSRANFIGESRQRDRDRAELQQKLIEEAKRTKSPRCNVEDNGQVLYVDERGRPQRFNNMKEASKIIPHDQLVNPFTGETYTGGIQDTMENIHIDRKSRNEARQQLINEGVNFRWMPAEDEDLMIERRALDNMANSSPRPQQQEKPKRRLFGLW